MRRPQPGDCPEYYFTYIDKVPDAPVLELLESQIDETLELLAPLTEEQAKFAYARGKWSVKGVVAHMVDAERVFAFRSLHFARQDPAPLPGMEQDPWAANSGAEHRTLADLLDEFRLARISHLALFRSFDPETLGRRGKADRGTFSVHTLPFIVAGHEIHHRRILEEEYLGAMAR